MQDLYSPDILRFAANIACIGELDEPHATASGVSRTCGARIQVGVCVEQGRIVAFAQKIQSCVLGQAAASVLAANILGASVAELEDATEGLGQMLRHGTPLPEGRFGDLRALLPVHTFPARHDATLLPFKTAAEATRTASHGTGGSDGAPQ